MSGIESHLKESNKSVKLVVCVINTTAREIRDHF